jgi:hypothetical protein
MVSKIRIVVLTLVVIAAIAAVSLHVALAATAPNVTVTEFRPMEDIALGLQSATGQNTFAGPSSRSSLPFKGKAVVVEHVVGGKSYVDDKWRLVMDVWLRNDGPTTVHLNAVAVEYNGSVTPPFIGLGQDLSIKPGEEGRVLVPDDRLHDYPLSASVTVEMFFKDFYLPITLTAPLAPYVNQPLPMRSYRFPGKHEDLEQLGEHCYWSTAADQGTFEGHHRDSSTQRFAYDLGVRCWNEDKQAWSKFRPGTDGSENEDYWIFGLPLYAMHDGVVYACTRDEPENTVGIKGPNGNGLAIQHGVDEYVNYAHMQYDTIPEEICFPGATVSAGQYLGNAGNSGSSYNPHLHTQVQRGVTEIPPRDGRPQLFHNIRALEVGPDYDWFDPTVDVLPWKTTNGAALGAFMLIDPLSFDDPTSVSPNIPKKVGEAPSEKVRGGGSRLDPPQQLYENSRSRTNQARLDIAPQSCA